MTTVETISIVSALVGITLAVVAILFTWRVHENDQTLNQKFTETLTSINEKSTSTQAALDRTVNQIVEAFIETRTTGLNSIVSSPNSSEDETVGEQRLTQIEERLQALSFRQRYQVSNDLFERDLFRKNLFSGLAEGSEGDVVLFLDDLSNIPGASVNSTPMVKVGSKSRTRVTTISDRDIRIDVLQLGLNRGIEITDQAT